MNLVATFDEPVVADSGNIELRRISGGDALVESFDVTTAPSAQLTFSATRVSIDPTDPLESGVDFYVVIPGTAVRDGSDNFFAGISDPATWSFTTGNFVPIAIANHSAADGIADPWVATTDQAGVMTTYG